MESDSKNLEAINQNKNQNANRKRDRYKKSGKKGAKNKATATTKEVVNKPKNTLLPPQAKKPYHSNLPQLPVKKVEEPLETCKLCNQVIENIAQALSHPEGGHCHFDCILSKIAEDEHVNDKQKVSYIGRGTFAVVEPKEEGGFTFVKRIVWENQESFDAMKKYVEANKK
ncbi:MAG: hypothetical protein WC136_06660 [Sphaerochaeta sp.]|jgi:hypothetical protein|nr:hypothetical protein [Sphaerochaeta sp.]